MIKETTEPMKNLSKQQKNEAEQLFGQALRSSKGKDYVTAAQYYGQAVQYGHPGAQNNLANLYINGLGVEKNVQEAVRLYEESAKHGNTCGMINLAAYYIDGIGVEENFDLAVDWLETAAAQKDSSACIQLAKAYDNWKHKDEEKKIIWYKKAAEYGNSEAMYFLGSYYAKEGDEQNKDEAIKYYDQAAKYGDDKMKLKVAEAYDIPKWGTKPALNLDKAEYWYKEVACGTDKALKLEAAKGLDAKYNPEGECRRKALGARLAYMTYRSLINDYNEAYELAAYCCEIGSGTSANIDMAIMLYERGGYKEKAEWCKKKKIGKMVDEVFEKHSIYEMSAIEKNSHSSNTEYCTSSIDSVNAEFKGKVYYIAWDGYLCCSNLEGENVVILAEINKDYSYIHVNATGIYIYGRGDADRILVQHFSFEGNLISECKEEYEECEYGYENVHSIFSLYFYDNTVYYVYENSKQHICQIKCMHIDDKRIDVLYNRATSVGALYATADEVIFNAEYENKDYDEYSGRVWMILNKNSGMVECLSNPYCNPENVIYNPAIYDPEKPEYNDKCNFDRNIVFFDLTRLIFWTRRYVMEGESSRFLKKIEYWEPHMLRGDRDSVVANMPVWRIGDSNISRGREYFDGIHYYYSKSYVEFRSSDRFGNVYDWTANYGGSHGCCEQYRVIGNYLYLDIEAYGEEQYPLTVDICEPIRKSWFNEHLKPDIIERYKNNEPSFSLGIDTCRSESIEDDDFWNIKETNTDVTENLVVEKVIGNTDMKYSICTLGAKFHIGFGVKVTLKINGKQYNVKFHNSSKGRIDGMKKVYSENGIVLGDRLRATYIAELNEVHLEKMN